MSLLTKHLFSSFIYFSSESLYSKVSVPTPLQHGDMVRPFLSDIHPFALEEKGTFKCNVQQPMNNDTP